MVFPEDDVDARLVYPRSMPEGMETLLCWNSDVILCLDPLVIFYICNRFCNKHCNVSFCRRMYE